MTTRADNYAANLTKMRAPLKFAIVYEDGKNTHEFEVARVTDTAYLRLQSDEINPEQALKLAAWINASFGESISTWAKWRQFKFYIAAAFKTLIG